MSIVAHITLRATRAHPEASPLAELTVVCEEIAATLAAAGWEFEVQSAVEAQCVHETHGVWLDDRRCPEKATEVVRGAELCARHAAAAGLRRSA